MKILENLTNVTAPSVAFPYGDLTNNTGTNNGTPVNKDLLNDIIQFGQKLADEAGITMNDNVDNATNGWQLFEAFATVCGGISKIVNIGSWNMDTDATLIVNHGVVDYTKIRSIDILIYNDAGTPKVFPLYAGGDYFMDDTAITLSRTPSGAFDDPDFSSTGTQRGYISIKYLP
jgi:hypothetical protein